MSNQSYKKPLHARLRPILALGVPWVLGVGVLAAVQTAQSGSWLTRGLLDLWSESAQRPQERDAREPLEAHFMGDHVATLAPVEGYEWAVEMPDPAPEASPLARADQLQSMEVFARHAAAAAGRVEVNVEANEARLAAERAGIEAATQAFVLAQRHRGALSPVAMQELRDAERAIAVQTGRRIRLVPGSFPGNKDCPTGTSVTIDG